MCKGCFLSTLKLIKGILVASSLFIWHGILFFIPNCCRRKKSLRDRVVLITGSGSGIGRELALQLGKEGAILVLCSKVEETNVETGRLLKETYKDQVTFMTHTCDVGHQLQVAELRERVMNEFGKVDILINNAGIVNGKTILDLTHKQIENCMRTNILAQFWTIKEFLPDMVERDSGHIVSMSSVAGITGSAQITDYSASKFGLIGMMESLDVELRNIGKRGIHLTTVCPYFVDTGLFGGIQINFQGILPILTPDYVALKTIEAIQVNQEFIFIPRPLYLMLATKGCTPTAVVRYMGYLFGAHTAMQTFQQRDHTV